MLFASGRLRATRCGRGCLLQGAWILLADRQSPAGYWGEHGGALIIVILLDVHAVAPRLCARETIEMVVECEMRLRYGSIE